jgi:hypothetical protein
MRMRLSNYLQHVQQCVQDSRSNSTLSIRLGFSPEKKKAGEIAELMAVKAKHSAGGEYSPDWRPKVIPSIFQCCESLKRHTLKFFLTNSWCFAIIKLFLHRLNPLPPQALVAYLVVRLRAAIMAAMRILPRREGIVVIRSMILTPPLCAKLFQATFVISSSVPETKSSAMCAGKFPMFLALQFSNRQYYP